MSGRINCHRWQIYYVMEPVVYDHPLVPAVWPFMLGGRKSQLYFNVRGSIGESNCGHK